MKKELTKRDVPFITAAIVLLLLGVGGGIYATQKSSDNSEEKRMRQHLALEHGRNPILAEQNDGPTETIEQSDPNFQP